MRRLILATAVAACALARIQPVSAQHRGGMTAQTQEVSGGYCDWQCYEAYGPDGSKISWACYEETSLAWASCSVSGTVSCQLNVPCIIFFVLNEPDGGDVGKLRPCPVRAVATDLPTHAQLRRWGSVEDPRPVTSSPNGTSVGSPAARDPATMVGELR